MTPSISCPHGLYSVGSCSDCSVNGEAALHPQPSGETRPTDEELRSAIKATEYKYFGDYEFSEEQHAAVDVLVRAAQALLSARPLALGGQQGEFNVEEYVADYEFRADGEGGCYTPTENERALLIDAIHGALSELSLSTTPARAEAQDEDTPCTDCGDTGVTHQTERRCSCQEAEAQDEGAAGEPEWVVNDIAELGVKIGERFYWLYKGQSLVYGKHGYDVKDGIVQHDDGGNMHWRPVFKREFGECAHPVNYADPTRIGTVSLDDSDEWKPLPAPFAHPSPTPAADADRVLDEAAKYLKAQYGASYGLDHPKDRAHILAALKSEGK